MAKPHRHLVGFTVLQLGVVLGFAVAGSGCSSGSSSRTGSGGSPASSGGTSGGSGGISGGSGGTTRLGGATGSGGTMASVGTTSSDGTAASGGTTGSGGLSASGGATGSGGVSASGGATGSGGSTGSGGATVGGGGATANGGRGGAGRDGGGGVGGSIDGGGSTIPSTITLTSPVLMEGGTFPANITCADPGMGSPELDWTAGPSGTMSYAVTMTDLTEGRIYWVIWDIPVPSENPTMLTLPAHLDTVGMLTTPMGASQVNSVQGRGYYGPCLADGTTHTYRFQVYAIPIASLALPGTSTSTDSATASIRAVGTATGTLTAISNAHH